MVIDNVENKKMPNMTAGEVVDRDLASILSQTREEFDLLSGSHLLMTGGGGFLGYYLVQAILKWNEGKAVGQRIRLTVYDNFMRGVPVWLTLMQKDPFLSVVRHDITRPLPDNVDDFQYLIHAASIASPIYYRQHPLETMDANVNGLRNLLEYCRRQKERGRSVNGFLFFSSSEIYGDPPPDKIPTSESYWGHVSCTGPRACYDESKRYGETLCVNFARVYDFPIKSARPFNNYGPGLKITDRRVIPDFARNIFSGKDITILSSGSPTRTFCYISDAIAGYLKILVKGGKGEAYNIGVEGPEISVATLANRMVEIGRQLFGYSGRVIFEKSSDENYLVDNPNRRCPNIDKARSQLGFSPTVPFEEGLKRTLIWYSEHQEAEEA